MSVAKCLGVDDLDAPNMQEIRAEWPRWQDAEPALAVVADIASLPRWMKQAAPFARDAVLAGLRRLAEHDPRAYLALAWLLVTRRLAGRRSAAPAHRRDRRGRRRPTVDPDLRARSGRRHVRRDDGPQAG